MPRPDTSSYFFCFCVIRGGSNRQSTFCNPRKKEIGYPHEEVIARVNLGEGVNHWHFAFHLKRWLTVCVKSQSQMSILGEGFTINMEGLTLISLSMWISHCRSSILGGGAHNYAAPLSPCKGIESRSYGAHNMWETRTCFMCWVLLPIQFNIMSPCLVSQN